MLRGKWTKYNGNNGYVNYRDNYNISLVCGNVYATDVLAAFSHWTHYHTNHKLLVCDLQGVFNKEGRLPFFELTDPAICSRHRGRCRYGRTDLGFRGMRAFGSRHRCNSVCRRLGLPPFGLNRRAPMSSGRSPRIPKTPGK